MNAATLTAQQAREQLGDLPAELRTIDTLTMAELQAKFAAVFGHATASRNRSYLQRKLKYRVQELALGGLSDRARARADVLADVGRVKHGASGPREPGAPAVVRAVAPAAGPAVGPAPGTHLRRSYAGKEHDVLALPDGRFQWEGREFTSLSTIAKQITGTTWNGNVFFGLKARSTKRPR